MRLFLYLISFLLLSACTTASFPQLLISADKQLFIKGMEQVDAGEKPVPAFTALQQDYPASPWTQRARIVSKLLQTINNQQRRIDTLEREQRSRRQQDEILRQQKEALEADLQRLKQLLIDLESRRN